jgi:circadian clock protein KaiC
LSTQDKVKINKLPTGVPGLDEIVGGGLPEFSFNIIAGAPGSGKTTLAHQFVFANATPERPALYFTVLGESAIKMLRYQQQYTFFDPAKLPGSIRFINLSQVVLEKDLGAVLEQITIEVEKHNPPLWWLTPSGQWFGSRKATWTCNPSFNGWPCFWLVGKLQLS